MEIKERYGIHTILNSKEYKIGIEVGSFEGEFAKIILSRWDGILYSLDVWRKLDEKEYEDTSNKTPYETLYKVIDNVNDYVDRSVLIRTTSEYGSKMFPDEYFDFVYIDANHRYEYAKEDIDLWYPKVKKGGMMSGHDYIKEYYEYTKRSKMVGNDVKIYSAQTGEYHGLFGVTLAVDEFVKKENKELFVTDEYFGTWYIFK